MQERTPVKTKGRLLSRAIAAGKELFLITLWVWGNGDQGSSQQPRQKLYTLGALEKVDQWQWARELKAVLDAHQNQTPTETLP